jgi:hypothetical protein
MPHAFGMPYDWTLASRSIEKLEHDTKPSTDRRSTEAIPDFRMVSDDDDFERHMIHEDECAVAFDWRSWRAEGISGTLNDGSIRCYNVKVDAICANFAEIRRSWSRQQSSSLIVIVTALPQSLEELEGSPCSLAPIDVEGVPLHFLL